MTEFIPITALDLPDRVDAGGDVPAYAFDRTALLAGGFDRVGYCLELTGPGGAQWVWTAMEPFTADARRLGLPTRDDQVVRQRVTDLEVASNVKGLTVGTGLQGYLEMWPYAYRPEASRQVSGASPSRFDADDDIQVGRRYGSFQVHLVDPASSSGAAAQTVLAVNGFARAASPLSLGIGTQAEGHPDWTLAGNGGSFTKRRLTGYARASVLTVTDHPQQLQLYPRDAANGATVLVSGKVTDLRVKAVQLKVISGADGWEQTLPVTATRMFSFRQRIVAELREYRFELRVIGEGVSRRVGRWDGVVAGDVYVIQGQSNAVARMTKGSSAAEESPFLRSFGSPVADPILSEADRNWNYAIGDTMNQPGAIGQWGIRLANRIMDTYQVPVAVLNGGENGKRIAFFQRRDADTDAVDTNYGRLLRRMTAASVSSHVRGLLWYQGETDNDDADAHVAGVGELLKGWRRDIGADVTGGTRYYVYQVRTSPCADSDAGKLREAQRQMGDRLDVTVLSTNGLSGHDGCHFSWEHGYRELGDHTFAVVARDLYQGPSSGVAPPNPRSASFGNPERTEIVIQLRADDSLTIAPGVNADFRINGTTVAVTNVAYGVGGRLVLTLSAPAPDASGVSYLSHSGPGPWIVNATGAGLLTFYDLPIGGG
ncbi:sialate O-acetylesterase [Micromonospora sp. NPDC003197]